MNPTLSRVIRIRRCSTHLARPPSSPFYEALARSRLALVYDAMGREQEARDQIARAVEVNPQASISWLKARSPHKDPSALNEWSDTWRRLGMPE